jgi:dodecin
MAMADSVYKIIEIVGVSSTSWEDAAKIAVETAGKTLEDLRVAEVIKQDVTVENGKVTNYRVRLSISFKYHVEK